MGPSGAEAMRPKARVTSLIQAELRSLDAPPRALRRFLISKMPSFSEELSLLIRT